MLCERSWHRCEANTVSNMNWARSLLYKEASNAAFRAAGVPIIDGWGVLLGAAPFASQEHYDDFYVGKGRGVASRTLANVVLHTICEHDM